MADRIFPLKQESAAGGGTENDSIPTEMDPLEDALLAKELFIIADETNPRTDTIQQGVKADGAYNLVLYDRHNAAGVKLSDILSWVLDVKDEDDMASDSATHVPTQQSVKAYVDARAYLVKISSDDTTGAYLATKLVEGSGVSLAVNNPGANETLTISSTSGGGIRKYGSVLLASFAGNPKKYSVVFNTPYSDTSYAVDLTPEVLSSGNAAYIPTVESKLTTGFTINMATNNITNLVAVMWSTAPYFDP